MLGPSALQPHMLQLSGLGCQGPQPLRLSISEILPVTRPTVSGSLQPSIFIQNQLHTFSYLLSTSAPLIASAASAPCCFCLGSSLDLFCYLISLLYCNHWHRCSATAVTAAATSPTSTTFISPLLLMSLLPCFAISSSALLMNYQK
jgi:hypothetical protein